MKEIVMFSGPATGLWICGPLMSLIDTVVIGQGSSIELGALGPATVICDYMSYTFMFLSIATSLTRKDKNEVQHYISNFCGCLMLLFTKFFGSWALTAFFSWASNSVLDLEMGWADLNEKEKRFFWLNWIKHVQPSLLANSD